MSPVSLRPKLDHSHHNSECFSVGLLHGLLSGIGIGSPSAGPSHHEGGNDMMSAFTNSAAFAQPDARRFASAVFDAAYCRARV
jgi:hypothetical protein